MFLAITKLHGFEYRYPRSKLICMDINYNKRCKKGQMTRRIEMMGNGWVVTLKPITLMTLSNDNSCTSSGNIDVQRIDHKNPNHWLIGLLFKKWLSWASKFGKLSIKSAISDKTVCLSQRIIRRNREAVVQLLWVVFPVYGFKSEGRYQSHLW